MQWHKPPFHLKELKIELTQGCPLNCVHCSSEADPEKELDLDVNRVKSLLVEAKEIGVEELMFSGAEPLLCSALVDLVKQSTSLGLFTTVYTTGINSRKIEETDFGILHSLKEARLDRIIFSLHGDTEEQHDWITKVRGSFGLTLRAIEVSSKCSLGVEFHFVPLRSNFRCLEGIVKLAEDHGASKVSILRFVPHGRGRLIRNRESLGREENLELKREIARLRSNSSVKIRTGSPYNILLLQDDVPCSAGINQLIITPDGNIFPCDAFKNILPRKIGVPDEYSSIINHSLREVWEKSSYLSEIRKYLTTDFVEPCKSCAFLEKCKSGCLAQKAIYNQCLKKDRDPDCLKLGGNNVN